MSNLFKSSPMFDSVEMVPAIHLSFDGGDIDNGGRWMLAGICCRECRQEGAILEPAIPPRFYYEVLACRECGTELTPAFDHFNNFTGRAQ